MKKQIKKIIKFYASIIMSCMGVFMFLGILNIVSNFYQDERLVQSIHVIINIILPVTIAYLAATRISDHTGGIIGLLASVALIVTPNNASIIGAFVIGSCAGLVNRHFLRRLIERIPPGFELLFTNLIIGVFGFGLGMLVNLVMIPTLNVFSVVTNGFITYLLNNELIALMAVVIEVSKVFFLNNLINHGILIPLGLSQVNQMGDTILFFLETNPGPGAGVILALLFAKKREARQMFSYFTVQFLGGIHEVYFPLVLEFRKLFIALIMGGMAGIITMENMDLGLISPVSPGSVFTIMLNASNSDRLLVLAPIGISLLVSFFSAIVILQISTASHGGKKSSVLKLGPIKKIVFTCDGGFGSSVMGASLFNRKIKKYDFNLTVKAQGINNIDEDVSLIVVQTGLEKMAREKYPHKEIYPVNEFLDNGSYDELIAMLEERNRNNEL